MQIVDILHLAKINAELLDGVEHFLVEERDLRLDQTLQEQRQDSHNTLLSLLILDAATLVDLLIQVGLDVLVRQLDSLGNL